jgi:hypothetical protein
VSPDELRTRIYQSHPVVPWGRSREAGRAEGVLAAGGGEAGACQGLGRAIAEGALERQVPTVLVAGRRGHGGTLQRPEGQFGMMVMMMMVMMMMMMMMMLLMVEVVVMG